MKIPSQNFHVIINVGEEENVAAEHYELVDELLGQMENSWVESESFSFAASKK